MFKPHQSANIFTAIFRMCTCTGACKEKGFHFFALCVRVEELCVSVENPGHREMRRTMLDQV